MKKFKFRIIANELGAIGKRYKYTATTEANDKEEAILKLYDNYEHISIISINGEKHETA